MTTFLDKFVLTILAALFLLVITNPMQFGAGLRVGTGSCLLLGAYLCARAIHKHAGEGRPRVADLSEVPSEETNALPASVDGPKMAIAAEGAEQPNEETNTFPASHGRPKGVIAAESAKRLREKQGVARLRETQSGKTFAEIPTGSYCFIYGHSLIYNYKLGEVVVSDDTNLKFEVHKLADGFANVIAYVGSETRDRLLEGLKQGETLTVYSRSSVAAPDLVVVPADHLKFNRYRILTIANKQLCALDCEAR